MKISRFGPLLAIVGAVGLGAAGLVAWKYEGRSASHQVTTLDRDHGSRVAGPPPSPKPALSEADLVRSAHADVSEPAPGVAADPKSPSTFTPDPAKVPPPSVDSLPTGKDAKNQLAYANLEGAAPELGASSAPAPTAIPEPSAPAPGPGPSAPAADAALPLPPPVSQAAILYRKGDATGLTALAASAADPAERSALEWASLRADAHPSFAALADFLEAHPDWPSRGWIRDQQEADLVAHPRAPADVAAFFAGAPPQSSAGKIAAARAAQALGRAEEASQIIRGLWREGPFDALGGERHPARIRLFAREGRPRLSRGSPALCRLPQRRRSRRSAGRSRHLSARSGSHRRGAGAHEPHACQAGSASLARRSRPPVL